MSDPRREGEALAEPVASGNREGEAPAEPAQRGSAGASPSPHRPCEEWNLPVHRLGRRVLVHTQLDSTNTRAAELAADPANDGVAILADEQTAGRGQHGRTWLAPPRASVLLSLLLFPPPPLRRPAILTAWAAVAVCTTIQKLIGLPARIKWPNDILLQGRKVCGILIEQGRGAVVGVGLNVQQTEADLHAAGLPEATSLSCHVAAPLDTHTVARRLIQQLDEDFDGMLQGDLSTLEACWKWHIGLLGRMVCVECRDGPVHGRLLELAFDGLEVETNNGIRLSMVPERVQHLFPARAPG
jgi:BirA family transcriptional regulator, biotin operon repressor / biotin---[acetyl-CoA-carboxylase] ligase